MNKFKLLVSSMIASGLILIPMAAAPEEGCDWDITCSSGYNDDCASTGYGCVWSSGSERFEHCLCFGSSPGWGELDHCQNSYTSIGYNFDCDYNPNNQECYRTNITIEMADAATSIGNSCY